MKRSLTLFLDFETYYDSKTFTLRKTKNCNLSVLEYVRDERFKAHGLAWSDGEDSEPEWVTGSGIPEFCDTVHRYCGWENVTLVSHNIKFDGFILSHVYKRSAGRYVDTKGMSKAVLGKTIGGHSLAALAEFYGLQSKGTMKTDGVRDLSPEQEAELAEYCVHDVRLLAEVYKRLRPNFPVSEYDSLHRTIYMFVHPRLVLDVPLLDQAKVEEQERRKTAIERTGIDKKIFSSNPKFAELLRSRGYEVPEKTSPRTGEKIPALAVGDSAFLSMLESDDPALVELCEARVAAKSALLETRSEKLANLGRTGTWAFDVEYSGADQTHRLSGGSGAGGNPQNFTRDSALRRAVKPPPGYSFVAGDFSSIELRILAYLSKDPWLVWSIENGVDLYCDFASSFYGRTITKSDVNERKFGKAALLGLGYGMGAERFISAVRTMAGQVIDIETARKAVTLYRTRAAQVPRLWDSLGAMIPIIANPTPQKTYIDLPVKFEYQRVVLPSGLDIKYPNLRLVDEGQARPEWTYDVLDGKRVEHRRLYGGKMLENICQGLAGEVCKTAMLRMGDSVTGLVHDEIHVICRRGLELTTVQNMKRIMSLSPVWKPNMKLAAEVHSGASWGDCK